jgi:hypothetical protein
MVRNSGILWNPNVQCRIQNSPPFVPIQSQINPFHAFQTHFFKIQSNMLLPSTPRSSSLIPSMKPILSSNVYQHEGVELNLGKGYRSENDQHTLLHKCLQRGVRNIVTIPLISSVGPHVLIPRNLSVLRSTKIIS